MRGGFYLVFLLGIVLSGSAASLQMFATSQNDNRCNLDTMYLESNGAAGRRVSRVRFPAGNSSEKSVHLCSNGKAQKNHKGFTDRGSLNL